MQAGFVFPLCSNSATEWCIKDVRIYNESANPTSAEFVKYIGGGNFDANPQYGLPEGRTISLWKSKDKMLGTDQYFAVNIYGWMRWFNEQPYFFQTYGTIVPVTIQRGNQYRSVRVNQTAFGLEQDNGTLCANVVFVSDGECGSKSISSDPTRFGVSIVVPNKILGFLSGRLGEPTVTSSENTESSKVISLDASPVRIPRSGIQITKDQALEFYPEFKGAAYNYVIDHIALSDNRQDGDSLKKFELLRKFAGDKSTAYETVWNFTILSSVLTTKTANGFTTTSAQDVNGKLSIDYTSKCGITKNTLLGLVSTNAMIMDPNPPNFSDGEFTYNVAGMHFDSDGSTLTRGDYKLVISKALAMCLYGNTGIPLSATVRIIADGQLKESIVSTEVVRQEGDFLSVRIAGFTFSNPSIRVKFEYGKEVTKPTFSASTKESMATLTPTPKVGSEAVKKITKTTITCVKGKATKKVIAVNPKCPSGYKKK